MRKISLLLLCFLCAATVRAQDALGFRGGYKAFSRLCVQNLDPAARLLVNDFSRGYFVSMSIPAGTDTVSTVSFLTATPAPLQQAITWAMKGTNGQWETRNAPRTILVPIFFCQNTPPADSLLSQLLVANNVGFSMDQFPDQWPEVTEGVWVHPLCPLVPGKSARELPPPPTVTAPAPAPAPASATQAMAPAPAPAADLRSGPSGPPAGPDTLSLSGVFQNQAAFEAGAVDDGTPLLLEQKGLLAWFPIDFAAYGTVRLDKGSKTYQSFEPGTIYGFKSDGIKFRYFKSDKEYMAVLRDVGPVYLIMDERRQTGYNGATTVDGIFEFSTNFDGPYKELTKKAIENAFATQPQLMNDLLGLRKELNKHSLTMVHADFYTCIALADQYLDKYSQKK